MILRLLVRQSVNSWRQLGLWYQLQNVLLWGFIILAASYYLLPFVKSKQAQHPLTFLLVINGLLIYLVLTASFYLTRRLPGQLPLSFLRSLPFSFANLLQLFGYYLHRNWRWAWLIFAVFLMLEIRLNPKIAFLFLICFLVGAMVVTFFNLTAFLRFKHGNLFRAIQLTQLLVFVLISVLFFRAPGWFLALEMIFGGLLLVIGFLLTKNIVVQLEELFPLTDKLHSGKSRRIGAIKTKSIWLQLVTRDLRSLWRNTTYRKNKLLLMLGIPLLGHLFFSLFTEQAVNLFTLFVLFLIWWHYGQFFTPQYGQPEPEWFFKTFHLNFFKYFSARFFVEFWYVGIILFLFSLTLHLESITLTEHWQLLLALLFASAIILSSMISFQIIFYDDLRTAGFAFHFSLLFFLVLSLWDYFLGPLVSILFLSFYLYKSFRFLRS